MTGATPSAAGADVFDLLPFAAVIINEHAELLAANPAWERVTATVGELEIPYRELTDPASPLRLHGAPVWELLGNAPDPAQPQLAYCLPVGERWFDVRVARTAWRTRTWIVTYDDITDQRRAERSAAGVRATLRAGPDALIVVDVASFAIIEVNDIACQIFGRPREALLALGPDGLFGMPAARLRSEYEELISQGGIDACEVRTRRTDGTPLELELRRSPLKSGGRNLVINMARTGTTSTDLRVVRQQDLQNQLLARFAQFVLESPSFGEVAAEAAQIIHRGLGVELCRVLEIAPDGQTLTQVAGHGWREASMQAFELDAVSQTRERFMPALREPQIVTDYALEERSAIAFIPRAHGVRSSVEALVCGRKEVYGLVGAYAREPARFDAASAAFLQDIASTLAAYVERKMTENRLAYMAQFDALTGLPNRSLYLDRLSHSLIEASRDNRPVAVLFVDIDRFKTVNDTLGHAVGDQLLIHIAQRLLGAVRPADTVGRLSGDEFAVALAHLAHAEDAGAVARKIVAALSEPFDLEAQSVHVSASVGISIHPDDGMTADDLLKNADAAMYRVKEDGRNGFQFFVPDMHARAMQRAQMEAKLRSALSRDEFVLHFQPKFELRSGKLSGLEALLRWRSPESGLVMPGEFIPVLEESGLIVGVGEWIVSEVCAQIRHWEQCGLRVPPVAINISARQFSQRDLPAMIDKVLTHNGMSASRLEFELTEAVLMADLDGAAHTLQRLRARGLKVALDDFGTGYSSLTFLRRFPLDALKIDRTFVHGIPGDAEDATMVVAIINLAHSLGLRAIAEGVESAEQAAFLRQHGCEEAQGFYLSRPAAPEALLPLLAAPDGHAAGPRLESRS